MRKKKPRQYRRGETIFHQGDLGDCLHVIESGAVKIVLPSPEGEEGAIIATLGPGDFFGEAAIFRTTRRTATVIATQPSVLLAMFGADFAKVVADIPELHATIDAAMDARIPR